MGMSLSNPRVGICVLASELYSQLKGMVLAGSNAMPFQAFLQGGIWVQATLSEYRDESLDQQVRLIVHRPISWVRNDGLLSLTSAWTANARTSRSGATSEQSFTMLLIPSVFALPMIYSETEKSVQ